MSEKKDLNADYNNNYNSLNKLKINEDNNDYFKIQSEKVDLASIELKHPSKKKVISNHTLIVSSTQRDYDLYPNSNNYLIDLQQPYKNVGKLELIAVMLPK